MRGSFLATMVGTAGVLASACATMGDRTAATGAPPPERIAFSQGPCFGFCPVFAAAIAPDGTVSFDGERHTAVLGHRERAAGAAAYTRFAAALAPFRPATGTKAETRCEVRISDQSHLRIRWTAADGTETVLDHDRGCRSPANDRLNKLIADAPATLGIAPWAAQLTRPGVSRG